MGLFPLHYNTIKMSKIVLCLIFVCNLFILTVSFGIVGPADMIFNTVEECDPPLHVLEFSTTQKKFNRSTNVLDIIVTNPMVIDDSVTIELKGMMKKEGGYKPGSFYLKEPACKTLSLMLGDMFTDMLKAAGAEDCPLPAGTHMANDFYFDNTKFTVPQVYGEYKMEILISQGDELLSCYYAYYDLCPKDS